MEKVFNPAWGKGITVAPGVASARSSIDPSKRINYLCLTNLSSVTCYVRTGDSAATATAADYPVPANSQVTIRKYEGDTHIAYITASGTSSLHVIPGDGM